MSGTRPRAPTLTFIAVDKRSDTVFASVTIRQTPPDGFPLRLAPSTGFYLATIRSAGREIQEGHPILYDEETTRILHVSPEEATAWMGKRLDPATLRTRLATNGTKGGEVCRPQSADQSPGGHGAQEPRPGTPNANPAPRLPFTVRQSDDTNRRS